MPHVNGRTFLETIKKSMSPEFTSKIECYLRNGEVPQNLDPAETCVFEALKIQEQHQQAALEIVRSSAVLARAYTHSECKTDIELPLKFTLMTVNKYTRKILD